MTSHARDGEVDTKLQRVRGRHRTLAVDVILDVTLARTDDVGRCTGIVVMDPKYRAGASLADGIRDLHVYRDAILDAEGRRLVVAAVGMAPVADGKGLTPGPLCTNAPTIIQARPGRDRRVFGELLTHAVQALR